MADNKEWVIGICYADNKVCRRLMGLCTKIMRTVHTRFRIKRFRDGSEVLRSAVKPDLLILDTNLPYIDGITVTKMLRERGQDTLVLYVTDHDECMEECFGVNVHGFVRMEELEERLEEHIVSAAREIVRPSVIFGAGIESTRVVYVKAETPYCRAYFQNGHCEMVRMPIHELENLLREADFVRVHRSYLVNLRWVSGMGEHGIWVNEKEIPVSRRMRKKVKQAYAEYLRTHVE